MNKFTATILIIFFVLNAVAQEFNSTVIVNAEQTSNSNQQVYKTLERDLTEFINETSWTNKVYANQERIDCNIIIIVSNQNGDNFNASIQIQASRPVYGSTYLSPIYNYNDRDFSFNYREYQPLNFNPNSFDSNLVSVVAFHLYTILGFDASSYSLEGGNEYYNVAKQIVNTAASGDYKGWKSSDGAQSRYQLNDALISPMFSSFHTSFYNYHRLGLDVMSIDLKSGKEEIAKAVNSLKSINDSRPNSFLLRVFFDMKAEEIQSVFSDGPSVNITELIQNLNRLAPTKRSNWANIKF